MDTAPKPKLVTVSKVRRKRNAIVISYKHGDEEHPNVKYHENPLPEFTKALDALAPLVLAILHLPDTYAENLKISGCTIADMNGNPGVVIVAQKSLPDASGPFNISTPLRLLDLPAEEGAYSQPLTEKQAALIDDVIEAAKSYVLGERAQGTIKLEEPTVEEDDEDEGNELAFPAGSSGKPARQTIDV